jgi:glycosyltransferase involved in cell wall biosynthesis
MNSITETPVTIFLLARNRPHYLPSTLKSIEVQVYRQWRLVLSDNSTDEASAQANEALLEEFRQNNPDHLVRYVRRSGKLSVMEHFLLGMQEMETTFVAVHNDDDIWLPQHLKQLIDWLSESEKHGLATSDALVIDSEGKETGALLSWTKPPAAEDCSGWLRLSLSNKHSHFGAFPGFVLRTKIAQQVPAIDTNLFDNLIVIWNVVCGYSVKGFSEPSYLYRRHDQSLTKAATSMVVERHRLVIWLARHHFLLATRRYPVFPLVALKSILALKLKYSEGVEDRASVPDSC